MMKKIVFENLYEFQRGVEPKTSLKIGGEHKKIEKWLSQFLYKPQWKLTEDWTIDIVRGDFIVAGERIEEFPEFIQFNEAHRDFIINRCDMVSFKGFPSTIHGNLSISQNSFRSLIGFPARVDGDIFMKSNSGAKFLPGDIVNVCDVKGEIRI